MQYKWGIDLGGTKIEGVILNSDNNLEVVSRLRVPTEQEKGYAHILNQIKKLVDLLIKESGLRPAKIGMGTPGTLDSKTGVLKNCNTQCLIGQPIKTDVEAILEVPVIVTNDANCFAMAEAKMGVVTDLEYEPEVVFGVIMGTGVGGGLVVHGKTVNGRHGIGGEWGHNVLDPDGEMCYCGKRGCVEKSIAGPALEKYYARLSGKQLTLKEIYANYQQQNDDAAQKTIDHLLTNFGKAISVVINIVDPDVVVLGGGVNNISEVAKYAKEKAVPHVFNGAVNTAFLAPKLGDSAGVFGAALLV